MATLSELLQAHFASKGTSAREVAIRLGISYPSLLAWASKGGIPRKSEHRDMLRRELALPPDEFSRALAESGRDSIDTGGDGPPDLRQLLLRHLAERNLNERSFADLTGIPYAAVIGITQRGQAPRAGMIELLAQHLGIAPEAVRAASGRAHDAAEAGASAHAAVTAADSARPVPSLARLTAERIAASGMSAAAYAHAHGIAYLPLSTLLKTGNPPAQPEVLAALKTALGLEDAAFAQSLERTRDTPEPSDPHDAVVSAHPLHEAIQRLVREKGWTASAFAEAAGVSQLTAARLVKHGELPARAPTHAKLRQLLGLEQAAYDELIARSRPAEEPAAEPAAPPAAAEPEPDPLHPLHAAVRAHVRERGLTQQAFADQAGLSVLTTAKILKGELPGSGGTHDKLRQALAMDQSAYDDLVERSGGAAAAPAASAPAAAAPAPAVMDEAQRLARAIVDLRPDQRAAVWKLVTALKRK